MKILITGAAGQVGQEFSRLTATDAELIALSRQELDITQAAHVQEVVQSLRPNFIINAAAYTAVDKAESEPELAYAINAQAPEYLAKACQTVGAALLHISTDYVFDGHHTAPYKETDAVGPTGVYGKSKLAGEEAIARHCEQHIILRTAWVFGEHGHNFVKTMLRLASKEQLNIVADQHGSPTYAADIAQALLTIARQLAHKGSSAWGIYHYSGAPYVTWADFAQEIFDAAMQQKLIAQAPQIKRIPTTEYPTPAQRPLNSRLDCQKIQAEFAIPPSNWRRVLAHLAPYQD
ncbi:dTDP-4-dehydrorhamnose reductase [Brackiella oedipodis]|uniref:dTDP-4-dehydrorhamnose reductase n=1 Tax=Brackiella oedipodis TaxID=124225 RepID=UPI00048ADA96|nr:dTDP-4-dehydrorhamnose reductase [Brackiella oedipodis]